MPLLSCLFPAFVLFLLCLANSDIITLRANQDPNSFENGTWIVEASATLILPKLPDRVHGTMDLWSAILMERNASFLQGVSDNSDPKVAGGYCSDIKVAWCNFAYTLIGDDQTGHIVSAGTAVSAQPGSRVRTHYQYNERKHLWDQNVYIDDVLVSSISTSEGQRGHTFYISLECASAEDPDGDCDSVPAHTWQDIEIRLSKASLDFKHDGPWKYNAMGGEMETADGGKTWTFTPLHVSKQKACADVYLEGGRVCTEN